MRIIAEPNKKIKCKYCSEPFTPIHREHICMECKYDQDIFREELRESKQQK
jgi:Zn finger protein HypA/HybF involved in hydrogenase expression